MLNLLSILEVAKKLPTTRCCAKVRHVPVGARGALPLQMNNFEWFCPPNGISNLEIYKGKDSFCPSKVRLKAGFAPLAMTSS